MTDSAAFWGAVLQIVPVLALAFVVESAIFRVPPQPVLSGAVETTWPKFRKAFEDGYSLTDPKNVRRIVLGGIDANANHLLAVMRIGWPFLRYYFDFAARALIVLVCAVALIASELVGWIVLATGSGTTP